MKKIVLSITAAVVLLCAAFSVGCSGCGKKSGNYSETFKGAVSEETYETANDAVQGFLDTEISGKTSEAVLVDYKKEKELSAKEVESLAIDEEYREGLISVEKGNVTYTENSVSTAEAIVCAKAAGAETKTKVIYLLTYTGVFRFFTPAVENGDNLTSSYFDSTFDGEKYINCSVEAVMKAEGTQQGVKYVMENNASVKLTATALYEKDNVKMTMNGQDMSSMLGGSQNPEVYIADTTDGLYQMAGLNGKWESVNITNHPGAMIQAENVHDYFMEWFRQRFNQLDHTYFEKTSTGYALRADKYNEFLKTQQGSENLGGIGGIGGIGDTSGDFDLSYVINISDGRFSDVTMKIAYGDTLTEMTMKFTGFGKATITIPAEAKNSLPDGVTVLEPNKGVKN